MSDFPCKDGEKVKLYRKINVTEGHKRKEGDAMFEALFTNKQNIYKETFSYYLLGPLTLLTWPQLNH